MRLPFVLVLLFHCRMVLAPDLRQIDGRFGNAMPRASMESAIICDTARLRNHLWLDGMTYHGAFGVLVALITSSNASI